MSAQMHGWGRRTAAFVTATAALAVAAGTSPPRAVDWRAAPSGGVLRNMVTAVQSSTNPPGCDATWAFAAASMLGDRLLVAAYTQREKLKTPTAAPYPLATFLSPQVFVNCAGPAIGEETRRRIACDGSGSIRWALEMANTRGTVDATCMAYRGKAEQCDPVHVCVNCFGPCNPVPEYLVYNVTRFGRVSLANPEALQTEIASGGPVACKVRADPTLPTGDRPFHASVVGYRPDGTLIANPNFGTFSGNDTVGGGGFLLLPPQSVLECWWATPHLHGRGTLGAVNGTVTHRPSAELIRIADDAASPGVVGERVARANANSGNAPDRERRSAAVAAELDWRLRVPLTPVRSHHVGPIYCGACYSMATTSTYSDSLKIDRVHRRKESAAPDTVIAAQAVIDCVSPDRGCFGNNAGTVFGYMQRHGLPDWSCDPFVSAGFHRCALDCLNCPVTASSRDECAVANGTRYRVASTTGPIKGEGAMIAALQHGPIECMLLDSVPSFEGYTGGVICDRSNQTGHNHDVEIVGYRVVDGVDVWVGRNSWGTQWGMGGWFYLCRGRNNLGIESEGCYAVIPADDA